MKAIVLDRYGSADVLRLEDVERPGVGDDGVLVRVRAAGLDAGVWHLMAGLPYMIRILGYGLRRPKTRIPGNDVAGQVEAVGKNVKRFQPGDEVFGVCSGSFAEYACAQEDKLALKPAELSFEQAAVIPISALTALQGLRDQGKLQAGQRVLIVGAGGGVGSFAVQIAKALGGEVTGVCSTSKTDLVRSIGADQTIDYMQEEFADGSQRWDLILDTAGNRPLTGLRRALAPEGTLVFVGGEEGGKWFGGLGRPLKATLLSLFVRQNLRFYVAAARLEDLEFLKVLVETGKLAPVIGGTYSLSETPEAVRDWAKGHSLGKAVITI